MLAHITFAMPCAKSHCRLPVHPEAPVQLQNIPLNRPQPCLIDFRSNQPQKGMQAHCDRLNKRRQKAWAPGSAGVRPAADSANAPDKIFVTKTRPRIERFVEKTAQGPHAGSALLMGSPQLYVHCKSVGQSIQNRRDVLSTRRHARIES